MNKVQQHGYHNDGEQADQDGGLPICYRESRNHLEHHYTQKVEICSAGELFNQILRNKISHGVSGSRYLVRCKILVGELLVKDFEVPFGCINVI